MTSFISSNQPDVKSVGTSDWSRNELMALLGHDLRNSIQGVLSWANLICREVVSDKFSDEMKSRGLEVIIRNCRLQNRLLKQLIVLSRRDCDDLASDAYWINIKPILEAAINTMTPQARENGINLQVELASSAESVIGDPAQLEEVFTNLLSNAVKFTPVGGTIDVSLEYIEGSAEITVSDTGRGIGAEFLPYIFERYRQEKGNQPGHEGLGLGMSIVRYLVERHGGDIQAMSAGEGRGATFVVCLPLTTNAGSAVVPRAKTTSV
jgi:two-component system CheB/CheR fusion protein